MNPSTIIILTNLVPLLGVILFSWSVYTVLVYYWLETMVAGVNQIIMVSLSQFLLSRKNNVKIKFKIYLLNLFLILSYSIVWLSLLAYIIRYYEDKSFSIRLFTISLVYLIAIQAFDDLKEILIVRSWLKGNINLRNSIFAQRTAILLLTLVLGVYFVEYFKLPAITIVLIVIIKSFIEIANLSSN